MPKKKQVTFHSNIPGKFIPRDDPPSASGWHLNKRESSIRELIEVAPYRKEKPG